MPVEFEDGQPQMSLEEAYALFRKSGQTGKGAFNDLIDVMVRQLLGRSPDMSLTTPTPAQPLRILPQPPAGTPAYKLPEAIRHPKMPKNERPKIAAGIVMYNENGPHLRRCLESLKDFDLVIVIDGPYDVNKGLPLSTDGCREIVREYSNTLLVDMPYQKQTDVRNHYMKEAEWHGCDYLLVFECDEYLSGDMDEFIRNLPKLEGEPWSVYDAVYNVPMYWHTEGKLMQNSPRLMRVGHVGYGGSHRIYRFKGQDYLMANGNRKQKFQTVKGIVVNHDESTRTQKQQNDAEDYKVGLSATERDAVKVLEGTERDLRE